MFKFKQQKYANTAIAEFFSMFFVKRIIRNLQKGMSGFSLGIY